jgi:hypothetical protein
MKQTPHPLYSPDLAPSDFFLFGYVKRKLMDIALKLHLNFLFDSGYSGGNPAEDIERSFLEWMERLQKCLQVDGEYAG